MKLLELVDRGDAQIRQTYANRREELDKLHAKHVAGHWLVDPKTDKKLAGPFADADKANTFKSNRGDRIPANAVVKQM